MLSGLPLSWHRAHTQTSHFSSNSAQTYGHTAHRGGHGQGAQKTHPRAAFKLQLWCWGWDSWAPHSSEVEQCLAVSSCADNWRRGSGAGGAEARQVVAFISSTPGRPHYRVAQYDRANSAFLFRREKKNQPGKKTSTQSVMNSFIPSYQLLELLEPLGCWQRGSVICSHNLLFSCLDLQIMSQVFWFFFPRNLTGWAL